MAAIEVHDLTKIYKFHNKEAGIIGSVKSLFARKYQQNKAVDSISFEVEHSEFIGFIGPNGAGKTTTLKMLSGLLYPTSGSVRVLGFTPSKRKEEFLKQIGFVMGQKSQLWWDLPALECFLLNKEIYDIPRNQFDSTLEELAQLLNVSHLLNRQVRKLSLGERMKCELIGVLLHRPRVLFLDEPTIGLDVISQKNMRSFLKSYGRNSETTIILTSHYMGDVQELCERVVIINNGKLIFDGAMEEIAVRTIDYKLLVVTFSQTVAPRVLEKYGELIEYDENKATIRTKRENVTSVCSSILSSFDVEDVSIEEARIEDVIAQVFTETTL